MLVDKEKLEIIEILTLNKINNTDESGYWLSRVLYFIQALYEIEDFELCIDLKSLQKYKTPKIQDYLYNLPGYSANVQEQQQEVYMHHGFITMSITKYAKNLAENPKQYLKSTGSNEFHNFDYQYHVLSFRSLSLPKCKLSLFLKENKNCFMKVEQFMNFYRILVSIDDMKKVFLMPNRYLENNEYGQKNKTLFFAEILKEIKSQSLNLKIMDSKIIVEIADYIRLIKY